MAITVADNFNYQGAKPLDARMKFSTVDAMVGTAAAALYDGCFAYVAETKKYYSYDSTNTEDPTLGKWKEYSSGGGGGGDVDPMPAEDMDDIITPLPGVMARSIYNNRFNRSDMYDTNEVLIGKWIDGKPLYQKTVTANIASSTSAAATTTISGVSADKIVGIDYMTYLSNGETMDGAIIGNSGTYSRVYANISSGNIVLSHVCTVPSWITNHTISDIKVTICYTKTTDGTTKVSFDKDYSTDETIIGKWIDGKPIYQKVMTGLSISLTWDGSYNTKGTPQLPVASADLDTVIQVFGMLQNKAILTFGYIPADNKIVGSFGGSPVNILVWQYTKTTD